MAVGRPLAERIKADLEQEEAPKVKKMPGRAAWVCSGCGAKGHTKRECAFNAAIARMPSILPTLDDATAYLVGKLEAELATLEAAAAKVKAAIAWVRGAG